MKPSEYKQMMNYLTRPKKDTIRLPVTKYDTQILDPIKTPPTKMEKHIIDTVIKYDDVKAEDQIVQYDSVTGLFSNKDKSIAYKDANSARIHNDLYEKYVPDIQKKKEFVRPTKKKKELKPFTKIANNLGKNKPSPRSVVDAPKLVDIDPTPSRLPSDFFKRKEQSEEERGYLQSVEDAKREKEKELRSGIGGLLL